VCGRANRWSKGANLVRSGAMRRATLEELARDPVGKYVAGETFAHFCAVPDVWGFLVWGRPDEKQAFELGRSLIVELAPPAVPHTSIIDATRLGAGDPGAFKAAERYLLRYGHLLTSWVTRQALIRPPGIGGAIVSGAFDVLPQPYPVAVFEDVSAAFAWMLPGRDVSAYPALLVDIYDEVAGGRQVVGSVREWLEGHLVDAEIGSAASALGMSERTLQRKLGAAKTTFKDELAEARIRAAKTKLQETDAPLTAIAFDVGCASLQHFSAMFRKRMKESPSAFRARSRTSR
jgi:AraC-like DNA-binding protein